MRPILLSAGPFQLSAYWFFIVLGGFLCALFWRSRRDRMGLREPRQFWLLLDAVILGAFVGGRLAHLFLYQTLFSERFWAVAFSPRQGFSILGDVAGGLLGVALVCRAERLDFLRLADYLFAVVPLWDAVGRVGCLLTGCCYGRPTELPWGIVFPPAAANTVPEALLGLSLHPTQLYEAAAGLATGALLLAAALPRVESGRWRRGTVAGLYFTLYGVERIVLETFRGDSVPGLPGLSSAQSASLLYLAAGAVLLARPRALFGDHAADPR